MIERQAPDMGNEIRRQLDEARARPGFLERVQRRIERDRDLLDKLARR